MWIQAGGLRPVPAHAVVADESVALALSQLRADTSAQRGLDRAFRLLEREQPALARFVGGELTQLEVEAAQARLYFLACAVFLAFRTAFGARLGRVGNRELDAALDQLVIDSELRGRTPALIGYSEDAIALGQPALMRLVKDEVDSAPAGTSELERIVQALLIQILATTEAIAPA